MARLQRPRSEKRVRSRRLGARRLLPRVLPMDDVERAEREHSVQKFGVYLGPMILGSLAAGSIYRTVCAGRHFSVEGVLGGNFIWNLGFALIASMLAWGLREPRERMAFAAFSALAVQQSALSYGWIFGAPINSWLIGG